MEQRAEKKIYMEKLGKRAVSAKETVAFLNVIQRQEGLILAADSLAAQQAYIIEENQKDIMLARKNKMAELYRPPKVRPKNLSIGGRYFYG